MLLEKIKLLPDNIVITDLNWWQEFSNESYYGGDVVRVHPKGVYHLDMTYEKGGVNED